MSLNHRFTATAISQSSQKTVLQFAFYLLSAFTFVWANDYIGMSLVGLVEGAPNMVRIIGEMIPPDLSRIRPVGNALLKTVLIALVGTVYGVGFGFFLAIFATRDLAPHPVFYHVSRGLIALFRTVPDLIWAVFFVVAVGLGPFAGALTIIVDTVGFCGRFFAEAMEEAEKGPQEALTAIGASRLSLIFAGLLPMAMPSFINTSLFSLEKAVRSSVVLGLVGAGGIGIELKVAMDLFEYRQALTIIALVFLMVLVVEQMSARARNRWLKSG